MDAVEMLKTQAALAASFTFFMEWLKKTPLFPLIGSHTPGLNRIFSVVVALLVTAGFTWNFDGSLLSGGQITIGVPDMQTWMSAGTTFVIQMTGQHGTYKVFTLGRDRLAEADAEEVKVEQESSKKSSKES